MLIDTHTHIYSEQFDEDRANILQNAWDTGVEKMFLPAIDSTYTKAMLELKAQFPEKIFLMAGLHPTHVKPETMEAELAHVYSELKTGNHVAVGEIGIDLYWDKSFLKEQQTVFAQQIDWAIEFDLPIVIHGRESFDEIFEILAIKKQPKLHGIFHCFTGTLDQAHTAISLGMKLGIGGVVTFKNGKIDQFLNQIDLKHLVLETDSPYLAPVPFRGKRNEPAYVKLVAEKLSNIYGVSEVEIARQTTQNALGVFHI